MNATMTLRCMTLDIRLTTMLMLKHCYRSNTVNATMTLQHTTYDLQLMTTSLLSLKHRERYKDITMYHLQLKTYDNVNNQTLLLL